MRILFDRVSTLDAILAEENFEELVEACADDPRVLVFLGRCITKFHDEAEATGSLGARTYAGLFAAAHTDGTDLVDKLVDVADRIIALYGDHDPGNVRGALIEGLVSRGLVDRYGGHDLHDNVFVEIANGKPYRSTTTVDVVGWDGAVGECHDCKVNVHAVDADLIDDLDNGLPYSRFRIGIVTTYSRSAAIGILKASGLQLSGRTTVVELDGLWNTLPLHPATAP